MSSPRPSLTKPGRMPPWWALVAVPLILSGALLVWLVTRPPRVDNLARQLVTAAYRGDIHAMYAWELEAEKQANSMNEEKFKRFWNEIVRPRLAKLHVTGPPQVELVSAGDEGVASLPLADDGGHRYDLSVSVWQTEKGPRVAYTSYLPAAWHIEGIVLPGQPWTPANYHIAFIDGFDKDRQRLADIGINYFVSFNPRDGTFVRTSLDVARARQRDRLAKLQAESGRR